MGKPTASEAELWRAVDAANARQFIERLPRGLESVVGERGVKLSVGEKQRLSIARALLKDPPILILDEATASVDTATERLIQEALEHLMANRYVDCDCAPAFNDRRCGPDPGAGSRPHTRARHTRRIAPTGSKICAAMPAEPVGLIASARNRLRRGNCHLRSYGTGRAAIVGLTSYHTK